MGDAVVISEAMGKVLGMAMAYGVSALGLLLAYINYRMRILKADRVMSPVAWIVVAATIVSIALGGLGVVWLAASAPPAEVAPPPLLAEELVEAAAPPETAVAEPGEEWPLVGILVPGLVFLVATWTTAALHRHFSRTGLTESGDSSHA
jgi:hypothetical protein